MTQYHKSRIYYYLIQHCNFQLSTLRLLNENNLEKLAAEYHFKK